jgi:hypothetical protein
LLVDSDIGPPCSYDTCGSHQEGVVQPAAFWLNHDSAKCCASNGTGYLYVKLDDLTFLFLHCLVPDLSFGEIRIIRDIEIVQVIKKGGWRWDIIPSVCNVSVWKLDWVSIIFVLDCVQLAKNAGKCLWHFCTRKAGSGIASRRIQAV